MFNSYLCLCLSYINSSPYISIALEPFLNLHGCNPNLIGAPEASKSFCSGIKSITGSGVFGFISELWAFFRPSTFLANSTTANCIPKHNPRNGILFSLAYFIAAILPSMPLSPNPPGTKITSLSISIPLLSSISSAWTHFIFTSTSLYMPPCLKDSATDK